MDDVKRINRERGQHWFSPDTMRFFRSKIETEGALIGDKYFITSEQRDYDTPRLYSVRIFDRGTGAVNTVGEFQEFRSKKAARVFATCMADENDVETCRRRASFV